MAKKLIFLLKLWTFLMISISPSTIRKNQIFLSLGPIFLKLPFLLAYSSTIVNKKDPSSINYHYFFPKFAISTQNLWVMCLRVCFKFTRNCDQSFQISSAKLKNKTASVKMVHLSRTSASKLNRKMPQTTTTRPPNSSNRHQHLPTAITDKSQARATTKQ